MSDTWSDEALVARARRMYEVDGKSAAEVGAALGLTRNQIVGKASRQGWVRNPVDRTRNLARLTPRPAPSEAPAHPRPAPRVRRVADKACTGCAHFREKNREGHNPRRNMPGVAPSDWKMECCWFWTAEGRAASADDRLSMSLVSASGGRDCSRRRTTP